MKPILLVPKTVLYNLYYISLTITQALLFRPEKWRMPETTTTCSVAGSVVSALGCILAYLLVAALAVLATVHAGYVVFLGWEFFLTLTVVVGLAVVTYRAMKKRNRQHRETDVRPGTSTTEFVRVAMRSWKERICTEVRVQTPREVEFFSWLPEGGDLFAIFAASVVVIFLAFLVHVVIADNTVIYEGPCAITYEVDGNELGVSAQCGDMPPARILSTGNIPLALYRHDDTLRCQVSKLATTCYLTD